MQSSIGGYALISIVLLASVTLKSLNLKHSRLSENLKPHHVRRALVIGNQNYVRQSLKNPIHDATDMASALRTLGFESAVVLDANHGKMITAVDAFVGSLEQGDVGVFFYSGHGFQLDSNNYLEPIEF